LQKPFKNKKISKSCGTCILIGSAGLSLEPTAFQELLEKILPQLFATASCTDGAYISIATGF